MARLSVPSSQKALLLELKGLQEEPVEGFRVSLVDEGDLYNWEVAIFGPPNTHYEGGYFKVVKPHTPLIKFPDRKSTPKPNMQESLQSRVPPLHGIASQFSAESKAPSSQNTLFTGRIQGIPDTAELIRTLPQKYRRKPMSVEEMEYIQRGGPE